MGYKYMSLVCDICGKKSISGGSIIRKGLPKKVGGIGTHIVKNNKRTFKPNIRTIKIESTRGAVKKIKICTACLRSEKFSEKVN
jgi:large subunit ribosomal protein L28